MSEENAIIVGTLIQAFGYSGITLWLTAIEFSESKIRKQEQIKATAKETSDMIIQRTNGNFIASLEALRLVSVQLQQHNEHELAQAIEEEILILSEQYTFSMRGRHDKAS